MTFSIADVADLVTLDTGADVTMFPDAPEGQR